MEGGCSSPVKDHWYLTIKNGKNTFRVEVRVRVRVRVMIRIGLGKEIGK